MTQLAWAVDGSQDGTPLQCCVMGTSPRALAILLASCRKPFVRGRQRRAASPSVCRIRSLDGLPPALEGRHLARSRHAQNTSVESLCSRARSRRLWRTRLLEPMVACLSMRSLESFGRRTRFTEILLRVYLRLGLGKGRPPRGLGLVETSGAIDPGGGLNTYPGGGLNTYPGGD